MLELEGATTVLAGSLTGSVGGPIVVVTGTSGLAGAGVVCIAEEGAALVASVPRPVGNRCEGNRLGSDSTPGGGLTLTYF